MNTHRPPLNLRTLYPSFNAPITAIDCGQKCALHNPAGKPFCCDICHAVPAAYHQEWEYLQPRTGLWWPWRGDECLDNPEDPAALTADTPDSMILLACLGPEHCQREYRLLSCRQFPFFPYITTDYRFIGLAPEWEFFDTCWVLSNLDQVTPTYRQEFIQTYDSIFSLWLDEMDGYAAKAEDARAASTAQNRRLPLLHRNGHTYLLNPETERLTPVPATSFPKHSPYK